MDNKEALVSILKKKDTLRKEFNKNQSDIQEVLPIQLKDISLFHITELTFEEKSPRKEALENVISSLRFDGISFIYLLLGNKDGVSFYFGIAKDQKYQDELELDVDDIVSCVLKPNIEGNFRGSKIVEIDNKKEIISKISSMKRFARVDGVPSINEDSEDFQGVDRLVDIMAGDEFGLLVISDPLTIDEIQDIENQLYDIYNKLSPLLKTTIQETEGKTITEGKNESKSTSKTTGESKSISESNSKGTSTGTSASRGESSGSSYSTNSSKSENVGQNSSYSLSIVSGENSSETIGLNSGTNSSIATNKGSSTSKEFGDKVINEWISYIDDILLKRLDFGRNKGIFHSGIYIFANDKGTVLKLGNTISSLFSGSAENKAPLKISYIDNQNEIESIKNFQLSTITSFIPKNIQEAGLLFSKYGNKLSSWLSTKELSVITALPQKEVVGLVLKEEVEFGLNSKKQNLKDSILLGNLVKSGNILDIDISIEKGSINKHIFITGVTGSGKTTTCQRLLRSANIPFMVIEPAKTEYRVLSKIYDDLLIFTLNNENIAPFRLNPFELFEGESITSRVDMIKANIEAAFDMEAAIPQIIETALYQCYEKYGWDISTNENYKFQNPFDDGIYSFPTLSDLIEETEIVVKEQGFDERLKNDYIGSIKARLQGLLVGAKGFMLNAKRSVNFVDLLEKNVIIELEDIKNGAEKSLIMGFILINLNEALKIKHKEYKQKNKDFKHITLVEEAHRLLSKFSMGDNPSKKLGVETFADMLAEVRKYGESLIIVDQIPNKLTPEVLKNTNTKIVHKLFASDDKNAIGNTMALNDEQKEFLSSLEIGRAIISNQDFIKPIQVQIKELEDISTTKSNIIDERKIREICLKYYQQNHKKGMILGLELYTNNPSIDDIDKVLRYNLEAIIGLWRKITKDTSQKFNSNFQDLIRAKKLDNRLDFIKDILIKIVYNFAKDDTKEWLDKNLYNILYDIVYNDKVKFSSDIKLGERSYLKT